MSSSTTPPFVPRVSQVALSVVDLRLTERWFREGLGFLPAGGSRLAMRSPLASRIQGLPKAASTCWWLVDRNQVFQLELFQFEKPLAKLMPAHFRPCDIGYTRIGVWVADFDASLRRLEALGTSPLTPALGQRGTRRTCVRSPDGVFVELMESDPLSTSSSSTHRDCGVAVRSITLSVPDLQQTAGFIEQGLGLREANVPLHSPAMGLPTQSKTQRQQRLGGSRAVPQSPR
jgi:catechol 2,3-dioxygenase-like lactoylglutathione lyase family enzyme